MPKALRLRAAGAVLVASTMLIASLIMAGPSAAATYKPPPIKHVWIVELENESFGYTFGASGHRFAPYLTKTLVGQGAFLKNYYGIGHTVAEPAARLGAVPFHGQHQAGIVTAPAPAACFVAFDVIAERRRALVDLLQTLTGVARFLTAGGGSEEPRHRGAAVR